MSERRQFGCRSHGPGDEARPLFGGELLRDFSRQLGSGNIDFSHPVFKVELPQNQARPAKGVRLHHIASDFEEVSMDVTDNVRPAQHQDFAAVLFAPIVVQSGITHLNVGAHGAVVNDDPFADGLEKVRHH